MQRPAHPVPYQGSKRRLAQPILAVVGTRRFATFYEPFAGSAAVTLAAASRGLADRHVIGDALAPLAGLWQLILDDATAVADAYEELWLGQFGDAGPAAHFNETRAQYNRDGDPIKLLYLLARCVKNAPRFGRTGAFNQSPDHRRAGMRPEKMRRELLGAAAQLAGRTRTFAGDVETCLRDARPGDLVYLDPPWQGTSEGADKRYYRGFARARLEELLVDLDRREVAWLLSYDGRRGERRYGDVLARGLWGAHLELPAGRSAQATLVGRAEQTVESLYVASCLA